VDRIEKKITRRKATVRTFVDPGHKTGSRATEASKSRNVMTSATSGSDD
jgi:hypothetical protein